MNVEFLKLKQFRNYSHLELNFDPNVNIFWGPNGRGKSNILEAIHILLTGESFRPASIENLINHSAGDEAIAQISLVTNSQVGKNEIACRISHTEKLKFTIDHKPSRSIALNERYSAVLFCPESLAAIKHGPEARRQLTDSLLRTNWTDGVRLTRDYAKCLKTKNKVLRDYLAGRVNLLETGAILDSLEPLFLKAAVKLTMARVQVLKSLLKEVNKQVKLNLNNDSVDISVDYVISSQSAIDWSQNQVYDALKERIEKLKAAELKLGKCLVGPQRHDIRFDFNGKDARQACSQGQQRAIILAVKMAQVMQQKELRGQYPVVLLDDVFSEFDEKNRESLLNLLYDIPAQKFMTTTELEKSKAVGMKQSETARFLIENDTANAR